MTIIVFLIDTSASMNQRAHNHNMGGRTTLLDVAKGAVEAFIKYRKRDMASSGDRYMLLTFEEPPSNVKAGWKENHQTFSNELKNLQAYGLSTLGAALKHAFDILNINRMQTGIDTYGQGRCPFYLEPSIIIVITDGGNLSSPAGVHQDLNLPMHSPIPGSELTREPFRWDQRLFSLVLRMTGTPAVEREANSLVPSDYSPIDAMCEVTGGRSYVVTSQKTLLQCVESIVQKLQGGVVINFEKTGSDPPPLPAEGTVKSGLDTLLALTKSAASVDEADFVDLMDVVTVPSTATSTILPVNDAGDKQIISEKMENNEEQDKFTMKMETPLNGSRPVSPIPAYNQNNTSWHSCRKMIFVQRSAQKGYSVGHWPIPEAFWPDINGPSLPPRTAQPIIKFTCTAHEPMVVENLPFDKYELEPSPLTQYILSRKQPNVCWQVFVPNSCKNMDLGHPFGYLKASTNLACVNLFVMPYNYPVLLTLLDELQKVHRMKPTREWKACFDNYLKTMPLYYASSLKRALQRMGLANLVPDNLENCLSYTVLNYIKRLKNQAKAEHEKLILSVGTGKSITPDSIRVTSVGSSRMTSHNHRKLVDLVTTSNPTLSERFNNLKNELNEFIGFKIFTKDPYVRTQSYRNPFDISKKGLLDQIARMRANYLQSTISHTRLLDDDQLHNQPVGQMGNYQEYLKRMTQPLRELESTPLRQHMFGNPFKIDKRMMVDEADLGILDLMSANPPGVERRGNKRMMESPPGSPRRSKRTIGPIPKDFVLKRPLTPPVTLPEEPIDKDMELNEDATSPDDNEPTINDELIEYPDLQIFNGGLNYSCGEDLGNDLVIDDLPPPILELNNEMSPIENHLMNHLSAVIGAQPPELTPSNGDVYEPIMDNNIDCDKYMEQNKMLKNLLFKEVRRYGKNYDNIFKHLENVQGSVETRKNMVQEVTKEAMRFKRQNLVLLLNNFESKIRTKNNHIIRKSTYGSPTSPPR